MLNRRTIVTLAVCTSVLMTAGFALAKNSHHNNGHNLLGPKLHQNGKHDVGPDSTRTGRCLLRILL